MKNKKLLIGVGILLALALGTLVIFNNYEEQTMFQSQCSLPRCPSGYNSAGTYCSGLTCYRECEKLGDAYCPSYGYSSQKYLAKADYFIDNDFSRVEVYGPSEDRDKCYQYASKATYMVTSEGSADSYELILSGVQDQKSECHTGTYED